MKFDHKDVADKGRELDTKTVQDQDSDNLRKKYLTYLWEVENNIQLYI